MKYLILILAVLFLSGCFYQTINKEEIDLGIEYCVNHGGLGGILENFNGTTKFYCSDGTIALETEAYKELYKNIRNGEDNDR